jgi:hypothetical protein
MDSDKPRACTPVHPSPAAPRDDAATDSHDPSPLSTSPAGQGASAAQPYAQPEDPAVPASTVEPAQPQPQHTDPSASQDAGDPLPSNEPGGPEDDGAPAAADAAGGEPLSLPAAESQEASLLPPAAPPASAPSLGTNGLATPVAAAGFASPVNWLPSAAAANGIALAAASEDGSRRREGPQQWDELTMTFEQDTLTLEAGVPSQQLREQGQEADRPSVRSDDTESAPAADGAPTADSSPSPSSLSGSPTSTPADESQEHHADQPCSFAARLAAAIAAADSHRTEHTSPLPLERRDPPAAPPAPAAPAGATDAAAAAAPPPPPSPERRGPLFPAPVEGIVSGGASHVMDPLPEAPPTQEDLSGDLGPCTGWPHEGEETRRMRELLRAATRPGAGGDGMRQLLEFIEESARAAAQRPSPEEVRRRAWGLNVGVQALGPQTAPQVMCVLGRRLQWPRSVRAAISLPSPALTY